MYSAVNSFFIFLLFSVLIETAPVISKHVSDVSLIISDSCLDQSNSHASAIAGTIQLPNEWNNTDAYLIKISKLSQEIQKNPSELLTSYKGIISPLKKIICVSPVFHCNLSMEQNIQFFVMTQLSIFANYLRSHERDDIYSVKVKVDLIDLKNTLYKAICQLKNVLVKNSVTIIDIDKYVTDDYTHRWVSMDNENEAIRRAEVMAELNILSQFFESFTFNSTSIVMKNNFPTSNCV